MKITFYASPASSSSPVACCLAELGVRHTRINLDLTAKEQRRPDFLALNPNGKVPTLIVDGAPLFEALAIMQWLGDRFGVERGVWPAADSSARLQALSWTTWGYVTFGAALNRLFHSSSERFPAEFHSAALAAYTHQELQGLLAVLDQRLGNQPYLLGNQFTLADLVLVSCVNYAALCGVPSADHARVSAWQARCMTRPSLASPWA